jgi:hypothetical protein
MTTDNNNTSDDITPAAETRADSYYCDRATYSPEDNKLRLYPARRLPAALYSRVKAAGFRWAPKQELFVCPSWGPRAEDLLLELADEIEDEDYAPEERSADRAERFTGYRENRLGEAGSHADTFDSGPSVFGHQSRARAERQALRHDRHRVRAVSQWSKAEYWQHRTAGVISHALHRSSARVRRGRLLRLEAEQRKHDKSREAYARRYAGWLKVLELDGRDQVLNRAESASSIGIDPATPPAGRRAYTLANTGHEWNSYTHPRTGQEGRSPYDLLTCADPVTPAEVAALWLADRTAPDDPASNPARWSNHYALRIAYEKAMLEVEGGMAADADMEPGGWLGACQIQRVYKSPATGRVTSVIVTEGGRQRRRNVERLGEDAYRAPTDEERQQFASDTAERKASEKATKPKPAALINPTDADAERLQAIWNAAALEGHNSQKRYNEFKPSAILRMTQAQYSANSKGSYANFETADVSEKLATIKRHWNGDRGGRVCVFKLRTRSPHSLNPAAPHIVILTDKPQKPLPWEEADAIRAQHPTEESVFPTLGQIAHAFASWERMRDPDNQRLISDAAYLGWAYVSSMTQQGFTTAGAAAYARFQETQKGAPSHAVTA